VDTLTVIAGCFCAIVLICALVILAVCILSGREA